MRLKNDNIKYSLELNGIYDPKLFGMNSFNELMTSKFPENKCFFSTVFSYLKKRGFSGMEFSFGPGSKQNVLDTFGSFKEFGSVLSDEGLELSSCFFTDVIFAAPMMADVYELWKTKEKQTRIKEELKETASMVVEAGCKYIPINPPVRKNDTSLKDEEIMVELYSELGEITKREGVSLLVHNESNSMIWSHEDVNTFLKNNKFNNIGLCPDIAHIRDCGGRPESFIKEHIDNISIMHWKDCAKEIPSDFMISEDMFIRHNPYYTKLGDGLIDYKLCTDVIKEENWSGWIVLEIPIGDKTKNIDDSIEFLNKYL